MFTVTPGEWRQVGGEGSSCRAGGGGGGSYNGGTNQTNTAGAVTGNGSITIAW